MNRPEKGLKVYLVGGAVRDRLLGRPVGDRDWVVVGATPEEMLRRGFKAVGRDFPVFLHPVTKEEYALARTERKTAPGYKGFVVHAAPEVTLRDDLVRRDLTINAMAETADGELVDYFGGANDLRAGVLRHVSPAFVEDPVRVLRVARFAARYDFPVAPETLTLMREIVARGETDALVAERVWQELEGALNEPRPSRFVAALRECFALARVLPEIDALFGIPQPADVHPEVDTGLHSLLVVDQAARLSADAAVRFAALVHDLGKALTPQQEWPKHHGHEEAGVAPIRALCTRIRVPAVFRDLALVACRWHLHVHRLMELTPGTLVRIFEGLDAFRKPERLEQYVLVCHADLRGRPGHEDDAFPKGETLRRYFEAARAADVSSIAARGLEGEAAGNEVHRLRCEAIRAVKETL
jgi:tRNA nucleotidyltransferase (CCA-adding enzyme)